MVVGGIFVCLFVCGRCCFLGGGGEMMLYVRWAHGLLVRGGVGGVVSLQAGMLYCDYHQGGGHRMAT
jgi:hypothetical protein